MYVCMYVLFVVNNYESKTHALQSFLRQETLRLIQQRKLQQKA